MHFSVVGFSRLSQSCMIIYILEWLKFSFWHVDRDLTIQKRFDNNPILWDLLDICSTGEFCSMLLFCAKFLTVYYFTIGAPCILCNILTLFLVGCLLRAQIYLGCKQLARFVQQIYYTSAFYVYSTWKYILCVLYVYISGCLKREYDVCTVRYMEIYYVMELHRVCFVSIYNAHNMYISVFCSVHIEGAAAFRICSCLVRSVFATLIGQWEVLRDRGVANQNKLFSETKRVIECLQQVCIVLWLLADWLKDITVLSH